MLSQTTENCKPLNSICSNCVKLGYDCKGTTCQTWTGCIYRKAGLLPGDTILVHLFSGSREIITDNHGQKFTIYGKGEHMGIKWLGDEITPLSGFAATVIFERLTDGAKFSFYPPLGRLVEV